MTRNWKTSCFVAALVAVTFFCISGSVSAQKGGGQIGTITPKTTLLAPKSGEVLTPGSVYRIMWQTDIPKGLNTNWCEQEVYLSLDGGKTTTIRCTRELGGGVQYYDWLVPNTPTRQAVLDVRFGCQGGGSYTFEKSQPQVSSMFQIAGSSFSLLAVPSVKLNTGDTQEVSPGNPVNLSWDSTVENVAAFEVKVSFDHGAHFQTVGKTTETTYTWKAPDDLVGSVNFKIVAHQTDGTKIESLTNATPEAHIQ